MCRLELTHSTTRLTSKGMVCLVYGENKVIDYHADWKRPIIQGWHGGNQQKWYFEQSSEEGFLICSALRLEDKTWYIAIGAHEGGDRYSLCMNQNREEWLISPVDDSKFE